MAPFASERRTPDARDGSPRGPFIPAHLYSVPYEDVRLKQWLAHWRAGGSGTEVLALRLPKR